MSDEEKTKGQLVNELVEMPQRIVKLEKAEAKRQHAKDELSLQAFILKNVNDGIIVTDMEGRIVDWNPAAERTFGYLKAEVLGKTTGMFTTDVVTATLRDGRWSGEIQFVRKDGTNGVCESVIVPLRDEQDNIIATVGIHRNITHRKLAPEALRESEEKYRALFEESRDAVYITTRDGRFVDVNQSFLSLFGYTRKEIVNLNVRRMYISPDDRSSLQQEIEQKGSVRDYEVKLRKKDGTEMECLITATVRRDADGSILGYQGIIRDISERKRQEQQLAHLATHDLLTNLPNRVLFNDRLTLALAHAKRSRKKLALMLLDLDRFKDINDTLGHSVGDKLLQAVGNRLKGLLRKNDTVARMGGDEFMLLLSEIGQVKHAAKIAQRVLGAIRAPFFLDGHELHVTTSIGVAIYPNDGEDADTLMRNVDIAMYRAKERGRDNCQRYTAPTNAEALE